MWKLIAVALTLFGIAALVLLVDALPRPEATTTPTAASRANYVRGFYVPVYGDTGLLVKTITATTVEWSDGTPVVLTNVTVRECEGVKVLSELQSDSATAQVSENGSWSVDSLQLHGHVVYREYTHDK